MRKCLNKHNYLFCSLTVGYKTYEKRFYCSLYIPLVSPLFFFHMKITLSTFISISCLLNNAMIFMSNLSYEFQETNCFFLCCGLSVYTELSTSRFQEAMQV